MQTVSPLASRLGLKVVKRYAAGDEGHLTKEVIALPGATLIAWRHEALHSIPRHLGEVDPIPPDYWPTDRFDVIWTFTPTATGGASPRCRSSCCPATCPTPGACLATAMT